MSAEEQGRPAAMMLADVVGSDSLGQDDEELALLGKTGPAGRVRD